MGRFLLGLLQILDQFPDSFNRTFDFDDLGRNIGVGCLAADRVCLAEHFLGDEIQLSSRRFVIPIGEDVGEHRQMTLQPCDLLTDIDTIGVDLDFSQQVNALDLQVVRLKQFFDFGLQPIAIDIR